MNVLRLALQSLASERKLPRSENELNRRLLFRFERANGRLLKRNEGLTSPIYYECRNQPLEESSGSLASDLNRPDFNVGYVDTQTGRRRFFWIEAKCLGAKRKSGWHLNEEYVVSGVLRFLDPDAAYAAGEASAAMVGYVESSDLESIFSEVNGHATSRGLSNVVRIQDLWKPGDVTELRQDLSRTFVPQRLTLHHFWSDMTHVRFYDLPSKRKGKASRNKAKTRRR